MYGMCIVCLIVLAVRELCAPEVLWCVHACMHACMYVCVFGSCTNECLLVLAA
jgi:hypothetical protein